MIKESITVDETIEFLNILLLIDQKAIQGLVNARVICSEKLASHPTVQVNGDGENYIVGLLGILNGLFGIDKKGYGAIMAITNDVGTILRFGRVE
jgi:hypothetical protein